MKGAGIFSDFIGGAFGYVTKHNLKTWTVDVQLMNGIIVHAVRTPSREWIDETADTVTGEVNLPPIKSFVFVLFPYGIKNTTGAIILFSVFKDSNKKHLTRLTEEDENKIVKVLSGNVRTTYDRETGDFLLEDLDDEKLKITLSKSGKTLSVTDWNDNKITANSDGMKLEAKGNTLSMESGKVLVNGHLEVLQ
jgi:hypothetical protein